MSFDDELVVHFEAQGTTAGFADRVLARGSRKPSLAPGTRFDVRVRLRTSPFAVRCIAAAAASAVLAVASSQYYASRQAAVEEHEERQYESVLADRERKAERRRRKVREYSQRDF